jgi:RNA polymerase subunit RPABC4/transcription elongation factor Spt4
MKEKERDPINNTCVSCDEIIPEGRQVCPICEGVVTNDKK